MKRTITAFVLALALALSGCGSAPEAPAPPAQAPVPQSQPSSAPGPGPEPQPEPEPEPIVAHLMVAGDIMSHLSQVLDSYVAETGEHDYSPMMAEPARQLALADYAVGNLETVLGGGPNYSGYPCFNSPDILAYNAKDAGFDLLATANNHTRDVGMDGVYRTLEVLDEAGVAHVGSYRTQAERDANHGICVADVAGISVAFLDYTYGLNGFRLPEDQMYAVNLFNLDYYTNLSEPNSELMTADMEAARALGADLIAVVIHWGVEYQDAPNYYQTHLAQFLVSQGADLVLGGHPHVLQPYETVTVTGWDGEEREGFVCYSLGNFISDQHDAADPQYDTAVKTTVVLDLELTKTPDGKAGLTAVEYTPYYMLHRYGAPPAQRHRLVDTHKAIAAYEAGGEETGSAFSQGEYQALLASLERCHRILGEEGDAGRALRR